MSGTLRRLLRTGVGVALLAALLLLARPGELAATFRHGDPWPALAAAVPFAALVLLEGWRITLLFEPYGLRYGTALRMALVAMFFGSFTPGTLGGEAYKVYFLHRQSPGLARPIALTLLLRAAGIGATLALAALYLLAHPRRVLAALGDGAPRWHGPSAVALLTAGAVLVLGAALLLAAPRGRVLRQRARGAATVAGRALRQLPATRLAGLAGTSLLIAAARIVYFHLLALSFARDVYLPDLALVAAVATVAGVIPVTLGGLGVQEGALAAGLTLFGIPGPAAVAASLLNRGYLWAAAGIGWGLLVSARPAADRSPAPGRSAP